MSFLLSCKSLTKAFGAQVLFQDISLVINPGDRIGLIGPNGSGKSTLLKILCGQEEADSGDIQVKKNVVISYLAQADFFTEELSAHEVLFTSLADTEMNEVEKHNRVQQVLSRAEFRDSDVPVRSLSGGWRKRLAICRAILVEPQLLVLDEPTNHLDIEGILWLEKLLRGGLAVKPDGILLVSHDRQFLENCSTTMVELSSVYPQGSFQVNGPYSRFIEKRQEYLDQQMQAEDRLVNKVRRETEWLRRGPKARTTKAKYRIDEAHKLQDELQQIKGRNRAAKKVRLDFDGTGRKTKKLLEATGLQKSFAGNNLFQNLDITLSPGSRLGLLGRNGCGKSTLMEVLAKGENQPEGWLDGGRIRCADNLRIVHFDQNRESLEPATTLKRALAPEGDSVVFRDRSLHVVSWAKRFLFRPDQLETPVGELSGGEQARILIAGLMLQPADILLLDEPTNDLDIGSLDVLEESLAEFPGALVLVTHDRYLLSRLCDTILGFDGKGGVVYYADYTQWVSDMAVSEGQAGKSEPGPKTPKTGGEKKRDMAGRLSYLDQREYDLIEGKIEEAESLQEDLERQLDSPETAADPMRLSDCWERLEAQKLRVEKLYQRWDELEEKKKSS